MLRHRFRAWLINKVRRLFLLDELVHYEAQHDQRLQQVVSLLNARQPAADELRIAELHRAVESATAILQQIEALGRQALSAGEAQPSFRLATGEPGATYVKRAEPALADQWRLDAASLSELEKRGLFILGCARSGTSVLTRCFNRAPEIFMLEEPNAFLHQHVKEFARHFNEMHPQMGNRPRKGTYVPLPVFPEYGSLGLYHRLGRQYQYVGDKVAIGPHDYGTDWKRRYLDFQASYFLRSWYFLTIRKPNESLWSMHKLFPWAPVDKLVETWLQSLRLAIDVYRVFPKARLLIFNNFGREMLDRLAEMVGVQLPVPASALGGSYIHSRLADRELPAALMPCAGLCNECIDLFEELQANICPEQLCYNDSMNEEAFFAKLNLRIQAILERLPTSTSASKAA